MCHHGNKEFGYFQKEKPIEYDIIKYVKGRYNFGPAVSATNRCLCLSSRRRVVLTPQPNRQKIKYGVSFPPPGLTAEMVFVATALLISQNMFFKRRRRKLARYPGKSVGFSPYHLHGYFHSAGKTATSRFHSADVSSEMTPPTRAWRLKTW